MTMTKTKDPTIQPAARPTAECLTWYDDPNGHDWIDCPHCRTMPVETPTLEEWAQVHGDTMEHHRLKARWARATYLTLPGAVD